MAFQELRLEIKAELCELVEAALNDVGAMAITLSDAGNDPVLEPLPGETPVWPSLFLTALFDEQANAKSIEAMLHEKWPELRAKWHKLKDQQWERTWLERFKPTQFGDRLWVIPSGSTPPEETATNIFMDPGLAFGTGDHPTTSLCMQWLDGADLKNQSVLDYGHGSGILSIAAHRLGANDVVGIDIDPQAVIAGNDNAKRNNISHGIRFLLSDIEQQFDTVVANILAGPLMTMANKLAAYVKPGGRITLSGVLAQQATDVQQAFDEWIDWHETQQLDGWVLLQGTRNNADSTWDLRA